ncbi:hypothetical protein F5148DRAFT_659063 [Russula earlei]|uniref:Uncharacterized protein n=1 Tax=Russula earlei TaxID=71964 RepID=A0ACC0UEH2_9AGAM|nr:hypothetical protein F5148DRAFT_659063 [Russula earlei]
MAEPTKPTLLEEFQLEFPSLDSSLIAAFLSERDPETLTRRQLRKLRRTLAKLTVPSVDLDEQLINETSLGSNVDSCSLSSDAINGDPFAHTVADAISLLGSPRSTSSSTTSSSHALTFSQSAIPEIPSTHVEHAITDARCDGELADQVDMEHAFHLLITQEYRRELGNDGGTCHALDNDLPRTTGTEQRVFNAKGKRKDRSKVVTLNDIRQQRLVYENASSSHGSHSALLPTISDVDIWTFVSSISARLAELLPPRSESFFKSFFHSPESKTPATAVRRALAVITSAQDSDLPPLDMTVLLNLQDILRNTPRFNKLSVNERKRLFSDAHLCLHAVGSRADDGLDLVWLLCGLDAEVAAGWKIAPSHQDPPPHQDSDFLEKSASTSSLACIAHHEHRPDCRPGDSTYSASRRRMECSANQEASHSNKIP